MGRTFLSVRQGMKATLARWEQAARAFRGKDREYAEKVVKMAKAHSSESFYGFTDPDEAAVFSVLVELARAQEEEGVDP
ncbi:MAG: hypothetical protein A4E35_00014 [Methanoregula sp. PtaU1.Bin051]|nr:MAG: hypothetical protein A4E35_00014 [Methanoregula sp. PtaU1.Bin051]